MNRSTKKRSRSGCLTCRDRHMKCDEQMPVCQNCIKSGRKCYRGVRLNFTQYSFYDPKTSFNYENLKLIDQSIPIARFYNDNYHYRNHINLHSPLNVQNAERIFRLENNLSLANVDVKDKLKIRQLNEIIAKIPTISSKSPNPSSKAPYLSLTLKPIPATIAESSTSNSSGGSVINSANSANSGNSTNSSAPITAAPVIGSTASAPGSAMAAAAAAAAAAEAEVATNTSTEAPTMMSTTDTATVGGPESSHSTLHNPQALVEHTLDVISHLDSIRNEFIDSPFLNDDFNFSAPELSNINLHNLLLKPSFSNNDNLLLSNSKIVFDSPIFEFDTNIFINLIQVERYYWLLDLFNELSIWRNLIPGYSLKIQENGSSNFINKNFLINCLINCSVSQCDNWTNFKLLLNLQLNYFNIVKSSPINKNNFKMFESLFISIVLNLYNLLVKLLFSNGFLHFPMVYNNQIRLFNKLTYKLFKLSANKLNRFKSVVLVNCIHSTIILKFIINELMEKNQIKFQQFNVGIDNNMDTSSWNEDIYEDINYDHDDVYIINRLNYFEVLQLNHSFKNFEINQSLHASNSLKLRRLLWLTIKIKYLTIFPNFPLFNINYNEIPRFEINDSVVFPNEKATLIVLLSQFLIKITETNDNSGINAIFELINNSLIEDKFKKLWCNNFDWMLN